MQSIIYNNTVNGNITSGTFNNSQVTSVSGQGNTANNTNDDHGERQGLDDW